jgi:hypothetical protein
VVGQPIDQDVLVFDEFRNQDFVPEIHVLGALHVRFDCAPVLTSSNPLSTLHRRFACARLSQPYLSESCPDVSATFTTIGGRWRKFTYEELKARDKTGLDVFWLKDKSLTDSDNLPEPDELAEEIVENLEAGLVNFRQVLTALQ